MKQATKLPHARRRQRGVSLINLIVFGIALMLGLVVVLPAVPALIEYRAVRAAVAKAVREDGASADAIRRAFDRAAVIDDITSIKGADLNVERGPNGLVVKFAYEKRFPIVGPANLVFDFQGSSDGK